MDEADIARCRDLLGVRPGCGSEELERAYLKKNFPLIKNGSEAERKELRRAYEALTALGRKESGRPQIVQSPAIVPALAPVGGVAAAVTSPSLGTDAAEARVFPLLAFDSWLVNVIVPPLLLGLVWLVNRSPLGFLLKGFQVWMHEFGHATAAWMCGHKALPLPFGWTNVDEEFSSFVYFGLLLLFGIFFWTGWQERKVWPMLAAVALAIGQFFMTWRMTEVRQEFWWGAFGGTGGQFYLSAMFMAFFFVELPEKFKWGSCRYVFFLIGATAFLEIVAFWDLVYRGLEDIPFGTMINGEEDQGGDMNKLMDAYGWTPLEIRHNFQYLGRWCWAGLGLVYAVFALRLNLIADRIVERRQIAQAAKRANAV